MQYPLRALSLILSRRLDDRHIGRLYSLGSEPCISYLGEGTGEQLEPVYTDVSSLIGIERISVNFRVIHAASFFPFNEMGPVPLLRLIGFSTPAMGQLRRTLRCLVAGEQFTGFDIMMHVVQ